MPQPAKPDSVIEEACLLARCGAGDRTAFRELYARYSAPLFSLAVRMVGDAGEAEEAVQDAFVKVWRNAASFDPSRSRPFTWAVTLTRRTCIDHLRKRGRRPVGVPLPADEILEAEGAAGRDARASAEIAEDSAIVGEALSGVSPGQRSALEMALYTGMTQAEIAERLGQPVGTVKSWIRRGLINLRTAVSQHSP